MVIPTNPNPVPTFVTPQTNYGEVPNGASPVRPIAFAPHLQNDGGAALRAQGAALAAQAPAPIPLHPWYIRGPGDTLADRVRREQIEDGVTPTIDPGDPVAPVTPVVTTGGGGGGGGSTTYPVAPVAPPRADDINPSLIGGPGPGQVQNPGIVGGGTLIDVGVPFQTSGRQGIEADEHDFTTEEVRMMRDRLDAGETVAGFTAPPTFAAGADQATQHANIEAANANYSAALSAIPNDGTATREERIAAAAANPAYNPGLADVHANTTVGVGTTGYGTIGLTKSAANVQTSDFDRISESHANYGDDDSRIDHQTAVGAATVNAAGIRNIGGATAQDGDNYGLPSDFLVTSGSNGQTEVWGPDGATYESVEAAQAAFNGGAKAVAPGTHGTFFNPIPGSGAANGGLTDEEYAKHQADRAPGGVHYTSSSDQRRDNEIAAARRAEEAATLNSTSDAIGQKVTAINHNNNIGHKEAKEAIERGQNIVKIDGGTYVVTGSGVAEPVNPNVLKDIGVDVDALPSNRTPEQEEAAAAAQLTIDLANPAKRHYDPIAGKSLAGYQIQNRIDSGAYPGYEGLTVEDVVAGRTNPDPGPPPQAIAQQAAPAPVPSQLQYHAAPAPAPTAHEQTAANTQAILDAGIAIQTQRAQEAAAAGPEAEAAHLANVQAQLANPDDFWAKLLARS